jgi:RNA polymerase sigma factor (sigma-70 family)
MAEGGATVNPPTHPLARVLRSAAGRPAADPTPDGELARRFHRHGDQDAFELLVRRHAPAVLRVCRAVVRDPDLAEDAAQAVFLVLARKAATVARVRSAAGWLARVAYRAANRARARAAARVAVPLDAVADVPAPTPDPAAAAAATDLAAVVVREVNCLPDRYHAPIVLCYLEGLTYAQAAERLGWPPGTVTGRLARARAVLRDRLARRGVTLPAAGLAVVGASGHVAVAASVCRAVRRTARPAVEQLSTEVIHAMNATKRTVWAAAVLFGLAGAAVTGVAAMNSEPPQGDSKQPPTQVAPDAAKAPRPGEFIVVGKVLDETGKVPMEGVRVRASAGMGTLRPTGETTTDKDGKFRLVFTPGITTQGGKAGGVAVVWAYKPGYYAWTYGWRSEYILTDQPLSEAEQRASRYTNLTPGETTRLEFRMAPAAALKAKLADGAGRPMADTPIWLTGENLRPAASVLASGRTDADGVFVARDVPCSRYRLVIGDRADNRRELELGSIQFADPVEYLAEATVHSWTPVATHASLKVTRGEKPPP